MVKVDVRNGDREQRSVGGHDGEGFVFGGFLLMLQTSKPVSLTCVVSDRGMYCGPNPSFTQRDL